MRVAGSKRPLPRSPRSVDSRRALTALAEVGGTLALRAGPGLLNLAAILMVAHRLPTAEYGLYSTIVATGGFVAAITFGVFYTPIVAQYPLLTNSDARGGYLGALLLAAGAVSAAILVVGGATSTVLGFSPVILAVILATGLHALLQELTRARLQIWAYVASDLIQACTFLAAIFFCTTLSHSATVAVLALSYLPAVVFSAAVALRGIPLSFRWFRLGEVIRPGKWLVLSTVAENLLFLGSRYVLLAFGATATLGTFALALDLAQRFVGFAITTTSFLYQPKAFAALAAEGKHAFRAVILRGGAIGLGLGLLAVVAIAAVAVWPPTRALLPKGFELWAFALVAVAVIINRLKKLLLDPFAMRDGRTPALMICTAAGSALGVAGMATVLALDWQQGAALAYTTGHAATALISAIVLRDLVIPERRSLSAKGVS